MPRVGHLEKLTVIEKDIILLGKNIAPLSLKPRINHWTLNF